MNKIETHFLNKKHTSGETVVALSSAVLTAVKHPIGALVNRRPWSDLSPCLLRGSKKLRSTDTCGFGADFLKGSWVTLDYQGLVVTVNSGRQQGRESHGAGVRCGHSAVTSQPGHFVPPSRVCTGINIGDRSRLWRHRGSGLFRDPFCGPC